MAARVNYLNNRDLLKEIHKSKNSYSSFVKPEFNEYDLIVVNLDKINIRKIAEAKKNRAARMSYNAWQEALKENPKAKLSEFTVNPKKITKADVVFRVMTYDHIPLAPGRKRVPKTTADHHVRLNFPPFQHWKFDAKDKLVCIGKSHWIGGMKDGAFSCTHGSMTNKLAKMFMLLCERYSSRSNWRGYTYTEEMKGQTLLQLAQVGLQFDESKSENPFGYYTQVSSSSFCRVLNVEKRHQEIRDDILEQHSINPSYTRQNKTSND